MNPFQKFIQQRGLIPGGASYHLAAEAWDAAIMAAQARLAAPSHAAASHEVEQVFSFRQAPDESTPSLPLA